MWSQILISQKVAALHTLRLGAGVLTRGVLSGSPKDGTVCIACPCDRPGGIIADDRLPIFGPEPVVRFDRSKAPREGTTIVVRIRPAGDVPKR